MHHSAWVVMVAPLVVAFVICALLTPAMMVGLRRRGFGQHIREDGPATHGKKAGTPSAGGVAMVVAICAAVALCGERSPEALLLCGLVLGCGVVGFLDDYGKASQGRSLGLRARHKMLILLGLGVLFSWAVILRLKEGRVLSLPFGGEWRLSAGVALALSVLLIAFFTNAVNLTDGLDGLAAGSVAIVGMGMAMAVFAMGGRTGVVVVCAGMVGACLGFLLFNAHPAAVFMGDTGALALGGGLAGAAVSAGGEVLLCVAGLVFVLEALSVVAQVVSFQLTGKRILLMSPLHHHFELKGVVERRVVRGFWVASAVFSVLGVALF